MLNKKIVIADIDDTLVVHHQDMSTRTREIIDYIRSQGVYFGLASGRPLFQIMASLEDWNMPTPEILVGLNGAQLYDGLTGKTYKTCELEKEWVKEAFDIMKPFKYTMYTYEDP
ncbi:MAG: HAD family phosphatase, partial [Erysipelotrichaceae bacterium]|nr:HAD family phosphatase [Erysipelotrichaceae bacterium]